MTNEKHNWYCPAQMTWHRPLSRSEIRNNHHKGFVKDLDYLFQFTQHPTDYDFNMQNNKLWKSSLIDFDIEDYPSNHFASGFPQMMIEMAIKTTVLNTPSVILDCFAGAGTTGAAAKKLGHRYIMIDINRKYCEGMMARLGDMEITR